MSDQAPAPQPPIFNLQAYSPAKIKEAVERVGVKKANLPFLASVGECPLMSVKPQSSVVAARKTVRSS
jgi:hypothetical protein